LEINQELVPVDSEVITPVGDLLGDDGVEANQTAERPQRNISQVTLSSHNDSGGKESQSDEIAETESATAEVADSGWVTAATHDEPPPNIPVASGTDGETTASIESLPAAPAPLQAAGSAPVAKEPEPSGWQPTRTLPPNVLPFGQARSRKPAGFDSRPEAIGNENTRQEEPAFAGELSPALIEKLLAVDVRLSQTISGDQRAWQLDSLEREAEGLLSEAQTVAEREAVQHTLRKIDRFAAIQRRTAEVDQLPTVAATGADSGGARIPGTSAPVAIPANQFGSPTLPSAAPLPPNVVTLPSTQRRYDAIGTLHPVVSQRPGAPQYALVDDTGQVVSFVSPTPDVDMTPFVGQRVGVAGPRGYLPAFRREHVTAGQVVPLPYLR
jgi:hypothetical protein